MGAFEKRFLACPGSFGTVINKLVQDYLGTAEKAGLNSDDSLPADFLELVGN